MTIEFAHQIHDRLRALIPKLESERIWLRGYQKHDPRLLVPGGHPHGAPRDRIFCALVSKASGTHAAIRVLANAGHSADAVALTRVLIENLLVILWINLDVALRLDLYCASAELYDRRLAYVVQAHFESVDPEFAAKAVKREQNATPMAELLGGTHHTWARRYDESSREFVAISLADMFDEVFGKPQGAPKGTRGSMHDAAYFKTSQYVHSNVASLGGLFKMDERYFKFANSDNSSESIEAIALSNIAFSGVLNELQRYLGDDPFEPELEKIARDISAESDSRQAR